MKGDVRRRFGSKATIADDFSWEVKRVESLNVHKAYEQAKRDARSLTPVVAHRRNNEDWKVTLNARHFLELLSELDELREGQDNGN